MRALLLRTAVASWLAVLGAGSLAALAPPSVELVRPRVGEALVAGTEAVVEWRPVGAALDPAIEEWEAFLSFDDGGYYAVRLTPHLDVARRRFTFRVPDTATEHARILLRFGDEVVETEVDVPQRFSIRRPAFVVLEQGRRIPGRGEPARPGEPGVVAWVEGSRSGGALEVYESHPASGAVPAVFAHLSEAAPALTREAPEPIPAGAGELLYPQRPPPSRLVVAPPSPPAPILLLGCRRNE